MRGYSTHLDIVWGKGGIKYKCYCIQRKNEIQISSTFHIIGFGGKTKAVCYGQQNTFFTHARSVHARTLTCTIFRFCFFVDQYVLRVKSYTCVFFVFYFFDIIGTRSTFLKLFFRAYHSLFKQGLFMSSLHFGFLRIFNYAEKLLLIQNWW